MNKWSYLHTIRVVSVDLFDKLSILIEHFLKKTFLQKECYFLLLFAYVPIDRKQKFVDSFPNKFSKSGYVITWPYKSSIYILIDTPSAIFLKSYSKILFKLFIFS